MKKIADILDGILGANKALQSKSEIYASWAMIVGEAFYGGDSLISETLVKRAVENSKVAAIKKNKIIIEVQHTGWAQILSSKQNEILRIIKQRYDDAGIAAISFVPPSAPEL